MFDVHVGDRIDHRGDGVLDYLDFCWSGPNGVTLEWDAWRFGRGIKASAYSKSGEILDEVVIGIKEIDRDTWEVVSVDRKVLHLLHLYR